MHRGKNKKKIIITISILLLLCGAGAIALLIYRHMDISSTAMPVIASADTHNDNDLQIPKIRQITFQNQILCKRQRWVHLLPNPVWQHYICIIAEKPI